MTKGSSARKPDSRRSDNRKQDAARPDRRSTEQQKAERKAEYRAAAEPRPKVPSVSMELSIEKIVAGARPRPYRRGRRITDCP